ncbi:MAG TPA: acyltransferase [Jatrophihabitans sp.]
MGEVSPAPPATRTKDLSIQTLRGLACILVVAYHVRSVPDVDDTGLAGGNDVVSRLIISLAYLRMPLFSFLSGFVYAMRPLRSDVSSFVRGKARRLLVPLLFVGTLFAVLQSLSPGTSTKIVDETPWYLWHIVPLRHLWFLESIFWVFVLVGLLEVRGYLDRVGAVVAVAATAVMLDIVVPLGDDALGARMAIYLLPFFLSGLAARRFDWRSAPAWAKASVLAVTLALGVLTQLSVWGEIELIHPRHNVIAAALGIGACLSLLLLRVSWRPLVYIGGFSFTIYLIHPLGTAAMRYALLKAGITAIWMTIVPCILAGLAAGIALELIARRSAVLRVLVLGQRLPRRFLSARADPVTSN